MRDKCGVLTGLQNRALVSITGCRPAVESVAPSKLKLPHQEAVRHDLAPWNSASLRRPWIAAASLLEVDLALLLDRQSTLTPLTEAFKPRCADIGLHLEC